jgi:two-component system, NarL family, response regulator
MHTSRISPRSSHQLGQSDASARVRRVQEDARIEAILHPTNQTSRYEDEIESSSGTDSDIERESENENMAVEPDLPKPLTILIADDHPVVREGLVSLISREPDLQVIAQARNGREALEQFLVHHPDVVLLDMRMPVMDGIGTLMAICEQEPAARVCMVTSYQNEEDVYRALRAGAQGFVLKEASGIELVDCIRTVAAGSTWVPPRVGAMLAKRVAERELTRRETGVLQLVANGKSNKEIGVAFDISEATVKVHVTHILEKLKVTGRTEAINVGVKKGVIRLDVGMAT